MEGRTEAGGHRKAGKRSQNAAGRALARDMSRKLEMKPVFIMNKFFGHVSIKTGVLPLLEGPTRMCY